MVGKKIMLPLVQREIPIIADASVDREFGTGAVKITPGARLQRLRDGTAAQPPADFGDGYSWADERGSRPVSRARPRGFRARKRRQRPEGAGPAGKDGAASACGRRLLALRHRRRADALEQWFVRVKPLAEEALAAVRDGRTTFHPKLWENTYLQLDGEHPRLVHLAPALVGPSHPGVLVPALRPYDGRGRAPAEMREVRRRRPAPGRRRPRHLVQLGAVAVLDARMARPDARTSSATTRPACW